MPPGTVRWPCRQGAGDAVAQHAGMAGEEIELMSDLQRQQIARVRDGNIFQDARCLMPAPVQQMADRGNMSRLLCRHRQIARCRP